MRSITALRIEKQYTNRKQNKKTNKQHLHAKQAYYGGKVMCSFGQGYGAMILTAQKLGYEVGYTTEAEKLLHQKTVYPSLLGSIETEVYRVKELILKDGLGEKADKIAFDLITEAKLQ